MPFNCGIDSSGMVGAGFKTFASWECRDDAETEGGGVGTGGCNCVPVDFSMSRYATIDGSVICSGGGSWCGGKARECGVDGLRLKLTASLKANAGVTSLCQARCMELS